LRVTRMIMSRRETMGLGEVALVMEARAVAVL
jgi:hypothetical protein